MSSPASTRKAQYSPSQSQQRPNSSSASTDSILPQVDESPSSPSDLPVYTETGESQEKQLDGLRKQTTCQEHGLTLPILSWPHSYSALPDGSSPSACPSRMYRQDVISTYFSALSSHKDYDLTLVSALLDSGLVTPATTDMQGQTPLLAAIYADNVRCLKLLLASGDVDVNEYGVAGFHHRDEGGRTVDVPTMRTPLQLAASNGNLVIVKLLMQQHGADDRLVAPDGQIALRLAVENNHPEVVEYLPTRRSGGFKRWKARHQKAMKRVVRAARQIYDFGKIFVWHIPKFLLYTVPKELIVRPIIRQCKWLQKNYQRIPGLLYAGLIGTLRFIFIRFPSEIYGLLRRIPGALVSLAKSILKRIIRIPEGIVNAAKVIGTWIWEGMKSVSRSISSITAKLLSLLHTLLGAIASFFRNITWTNIVNGIKSLSHALFISFPQNIWEWLGKFWEVMEKTFIAIGGCFGWLIFAIVHGAVRAVTYVPIKLGEIAVGAGQSLQGGAREVLIWINPKRK